MKQDSLFSKCQLLLLPIFSAVVLGLTRLPLRFDMLVFVAFIPLFYYFERISIMEIKKIIVFRDGLVFSTIYLLISIHWISIVTAPGFIGILFLFGAIYGCLFVLARYCYRSKTFLSPCSFILIWISFEFLTNFSEFNFPWFAIGYGLKNSLSLLQVLEIGGLPLLSLLILIINYLFFKGITKRKRYYMIAFSLLFLWFVFGYMRLVYVQKNMIETDMTISLVQGSINQDEKFEDYMIDETFVIYGNLAREASEKDNPKLVVFPESALPVYLLTWPEYFYQVIELVFDTNTSIFTGFLYAEQEIRHRGQKDPFIFYNTAALFSPEIHNSKIYNKMILVPFGERIPFLNKIPFLWKLEFGQANFERGDTTERFEIDNYSFSPLICFEIAFPLFIRNINNDLQPDFWVNITNDAWFKRSIGTHQHAVMAAFRTIETRKSVFRSANTGYTLYTTPDGQIHDKTELFERTYITGNFYSFKIDTFFVKYGFILPFIVLILFALQIMFTLIFFTGKKRHGDL